MTVSENQIKAGCDAAMAWTKAHPDNDADDQVPALVGVVTAVLETMSEEVEKLRFEATACAKAADLFRIERRQQEDRAEAAEASLRKLAERIHERYESYYKQGPDHVVDGEPMIYAAFLEELREMMKCDAWSCVEGRVVGPYDMPMICGKCDGTGRKVP